MANTGLLLISDGSKDPSITLHYPNLNIIAVHGLNGDRIKSWTYVESELKETMWLHDMLQPILPNARIMTFGYSTGSDVEEATSAKRISKLATELLEALHDKKNLAQNCPSIFIGHNIGGTIIKKALVMANRNPAYSSIALSACRLVFFGTPHRATDSVSWENISLNIIATSMQRREGSLSTAIRELARTFSRYSEEFYAIGRQYDVVNFYEIDSIPYLGSVVVDEHCASLGIPNEQTVGLKGDHYTFCKFSAESQEQFQLASGHINYVDHDNTVKNWLTKEYAECLQTFSAIDSAVNPTRERDRYPATLAWILSHATYCKWLGNGGPSILYVHGKPGSGKTTLAYFLLKTLRISSEENSIILGYFFDETDARRSSASQLLISFVRQLLVGRPTMSCHLRYLYESVKEQSSWTKDDLWVLCRFLLTHPSNARTICIIDAIDECDSSRTKLVKDLAELTRRKDVSVQVLMTSGLPLSNGIVDDDESSERSYDSDSDGNVDDEDGSTTPCIITLDTEAQHLLDIRVVAETEVTDLIRKRPAFIEFKEHIIEKLCSYPGTLQRVFLILKELTTMELHFTPNSIRNQLKTSNWGVQDIYGYINKKHTTPSISWARKALAWIINAIRPLKTRELSIALAIDTTTVSFSSIEDYVSRDVTRDLKQTFGFYIEIENDEVYLINRPPRDVLLESQNLANEYLTQCCLKYLSVEELKGKPDLVIEGPRGPELCPSQCEYFEFLEYAVLYWPIHYQRGVNISSTQSVLDFIGNENTLLMWSKLYRCFEKSLTGRFVYANSPVVAAAQFGFADIVEVLISKANEPQYDTLKLEIALEVAAENGYKGIVKQICETGTKCRTALHLAARNGHLKEVKYLLERGIAVDTPNDEKATPLHLAARDGHVKVVKTLLRAGASRLSIDDKNSTPIQLAARRGHINVVKEFLQYYRYQPKSETVDNSEFAEVVAELSHAGANLNTVDNYRSTLLHQAARDGYIKVAKDLLQAKVAASATNIRKVTPLHEAAMNGHAEIVKELIDVGAALDAIDYWEETAMHNAAREGHEAVIKLLLEAGASRLAPGNSENKLPLHLACSNGHVGICQLLLQVEDPNPRDKTFQQTPLSWAAQGGHEDVVKFLLDQPGIDIDPVDSSGRTPLMLAISRDYDAVVQLLLEYGANIGAEGEEQKTSVETAISSGNEKLLRILLQRGADVNKIGGESGTALQAAVCSQHTELIPILLENGAQVNLAGGEYGTPLQAAAYMGKISTVQILLNSGADPNTTGGTYGTALQAAVCDSNEEVVRMLLDAGANVNTIAGQYGTPLQAAAYMGVISIVELLLERNADPHAIAGHYGTALQAAACDGNEAVVMMLLKSGADVNAVGGKYGTALQGAAWMGKTSIVKILLDSNADVTVVSGYYGTALQAAAFDGNRDVIKMILDRGADVNAVGGPYRTALQAAVCQGSVEVVKMLLDKGADVNTAGGEYGSALQAAANNQEITRLLLEKGADVNAIEGGYWTALQACADAGNVAVAQLLLDHGADVSLKGGSYGTALAAALIRDDFSMIQLLLDHGAPIGRDHLSPHVLRLMNRKEYSEVGYLLSRTRLRCDICRTGIKISDTSYHCDICRGGDFDMCHDCKDKGSSCEGEGHKLSVRYLEDGSFQVIVEEESIVRDGDAKLDSDLKNTVA